MGEFWGSYVALLFHSSATHDENWVGRGRGSTTVVLLPKSGKDGTITLQKLWFSTFLEGCMETCLPFKTPPQTATALVSYPKQMWVTHSVNPRIQFNPVHSATRPFPPRNSYSSDSCVCLARPGNYYYLYCCTQSEIHCYNHSFIRNLPDDWLVTDRHGQRHRSNSTTESRHPMPK